MNTRLTLGLKVNVTQLYATRGECEACERESCTAPCAPGLWKVRLDGLKSAHHQEPPPRGIDIGHPTCEAHRTARSRRYHHRCMAARHDMARHACSQGVPLRARWVGSSWACLHQRAARTWCTGEVALQGDTLTILSAHRKCSTWMSTGS